MYPPRRERFGDELLEREARQARFTVCPSSDQIMTLSSAEGLPKYARSR
jgi:hypothetical protein